MKPQYPNFTILFIFHTLTFDLIHLLVKMRNIKMKSNTTHYNMILLPNI